MADTQGLEVIDKRDWDKIFPDFPPKTKQKAVDTAIAIINHDDIDEVATSLGISVDGLDYRIRTWKLDWCFDGKVEQALRINKMTSTKAAKRQHALLDSGNEQIVANVAQDVLDRVLPKQQPNQTNVQVNFGDFVKNV